MAAPTRRADPRQMQVGPALRPVVAAMAQQPLQRRAAPRPLPATAAILLHTAELERPRPSRRGSLLSTVAVPSTTCEHHAQPRSLGVVAAEVTAASRAEDPAVEAEASGPTRRARRPWCDQGRITRRCPSGVPEPRRAGSWTATLDRASRPPMCSPRRCGSPPRWTLQIGRTCCMPWHTARSTVMQTAFRTRVRSSGVVAVAAAADPVGCETTPAGASAATL
mmetsp:Transcript_111083/g.299550  ORF Transcript_111083/g.299550 Transcript_111083/m.299550 type:complete len:222 (+) Transcript_111083:449-1114(+)